MNSIAPTDPPKKANRQAPHRDLQVGLILLSLLVVVITLLAASLPVSIEINMNQRLNSPSMTHLLGTDEWGRDLFSCLACGAGLSLLIALVVVFLSLLTGGFLGLVAGLAGGFIDTLIMRIVDILLAFPGFLLAITLAAFFSHHLWALILILATTGWVEYARLVRGETLKYKHTQFILAAKNYNASFFHILFHHLAPLVLPLVLVQASLNLASVILAESSLNFLGIGLEPGTPSLGQMISTGRDHFFDAPLLFLAPGLLLFLLILSFNFIGEGLRKKFSSFFTQ